MKSYGTINVFGVSNDLIETYIEREAVDNEFLRALLLIALCSCIHLQHP